MTRPEITIFLCGDVMTGRGIDQILPHPRRPDLREVYVTSARRYLELAEATNGPIPAPVSFDYIWGDALAELDRVQPDMRIINLETAITDSQAFWPKGINYAMAPGNIGCLTAARIDCCNLANNHALDFGRDGLLQSLDVLAGAGISVAGAGRDRESARAPTLRAVAGAGRIAVLGFGVASSGIPAAWSAGDDRPGMNLLSDLSAASIRAIGADVRAWKRPGDVVVASIHWGANWGYAVGDDERRFAHRLVDSGGVDVVHGHSSHHARGIEVHDGRLILYGCGDFLNDYEGIGGGERYRGDLALMYLATVDTRSGRLRRLRMVPFRIRNFRLVRASDADAAWLCRMLDREGRALGTRCIAGTDGALELHWA